MENQFNNAQQQTMFNDTSMQTEKFSYGAVALKTTLGLIVTVLVAVATLVLTGGLLLYGFGGLAISIVSGILTYFLLNKLIKGTSVPVIVYFGICIIEGILFAAAVTFLSYYAQFYEIDAQLFTAALGLAGLLTVAVVLGTVLVIAVQGDKLLNAPTVGKFGKILIGAMIGVGLVSVISFFLGLLGIEFFRNIYLEIAIGTGPLGILFSALFILFACYTLARTLIQAKKLQASGASAHLEWAISGLLVISIINIYVEVLRLIIRILGRR